MPFIMHNREITHIVETKCIKISIDSMELFAVV